MKQTFTVPLPPSVNSLHRAGNYSVYNSVEYKRWSVVAVRFFMDQDPVMFSGPLKVTMYIYVQDPSSDLDNRIKAAQDLLIGRVTDSDSRVYELHAYKRIDPRNTRIEMEIETLEETKKEELKWPKRTRHTR